MKGRLCGEKTCSDNASRCVLVKCLFPALSIVRLKRLRAFGWVCDAQLSRFWGVWLSDEGELTWGSVEESAPARGVFRILRGFGSFIFAYKYPHMSVCMQAHALAYKTFVWHFPIMCSLCWTYFMCIQTCIYVIPQLQKLKASVLAITALKRCGVYWLCGS